MRRALLALVVVGMMTLVVRRAAACDPWDDMLNLRSTATRAGLVVAAHRADATLVLPAGAHPGEAFATFEVEAVLKGQPLGRRIVVATRWIRDEGVAMPWGRSAVLFLEKSGGRYYPVRGNCAARTLPASGGRALLADVEVPFDVLAKGFGFAWAEAPQSSPPPGAPPGAPPELILAMACAGVGFALGHRLARRQSGVCERQLAERHFHSS